VSELFALIAKSCKIKIKSMKDRVLKKEKLRRNASCKPRQRGIYDA